MKRTSRGKTNLTLERLLLWTASIEFVSRVLELLSRFVNYDPTRQLRV
jgi:hypothetical protein